jgi:hypothetical protein
MRWTTERRAKLVAMRDEGKKFGEIAEYFDITAHAVNVMYNRLRYPRAPKPKPKPSTSNAGTTRGEAWKRNGERWTDEENAELVLRKDRGENFSAIGVALNRTQWSCKVQYHALKRGTAATPGELATTARTTREACNERIHEVRCEVLRYASPFGELLGEPPIGRSALDKRDEARR